MQIGQNIHWAARLLTVQKWRRKMVKLHLFNYFTYAKIKRWIIRKYNYNLRSVNVLFDEFHHKIISIIYLVTIPIRWFMDLFDILWTQSIQKHGHVVKVENLRKFLFYTFVHSHTWITTDQVCVATSNYSMKVRGVFSVD